MQISETLQELNDSLTSKMEEIKELKETYQKELQEKFEPLFLEIFNSYPKITGFSWTQYTPYFNDGDTCEFYTNEVIVYTDDYDGEVGDLGWMVDEKGIISLDQYDKPMHNPYGKKPDGSYGFAEESVPNPRFKEVTNVLDDAGHKIVTDIVKLIESSDNYDFMKSLFGDHAKVIVTPKGIEVEEYNHD